MAGDQRGQGSVGEAKAPPLAGDTGVIQAPHCWCLDSGAPVAGLGREPARRQRPPGGRCAAGGSGGQASPARWAWR